MEKNLIKCKVCGKEVAKNAKSCPNCGKDQRNFFMRHKIITALLVLFLLGGIGSSLGGNSSEVSNDNKTTETSQAESKETKEDVSIEEKAEKDIPTEYKSALKKAKVYSDTMSMSKAGIYAQLTSEHGEKFPQEAAQYAIDNVEANWKENALKKAQTYQGDMSMSSNAIYDQLISEHGEKFTEEEAQYAIDNLK